jgi:hypothetical protein
MDFIKSKFSPSELELSLSSSTFFEEEVVVSVALEVGYSSFFWTGLTKTFKWPSKFAMAVS